MKNKITDYFKYLLILTYIITIGVYVFFEFDGIKYPALRTDNMVGIFEIIIFIVVMPILGLLLLFIKSQKKSLKVMKILLYIFLPAYFVGWIILSYFVQGSLLCSQTTDLSNYLVFDDMLDQTSHDSELRIFPEEIPKNAREISYQYKYIDDWYPKYHITLSYSFENDADYNLEKEQIKSKDFIRGEKEDNGVGTIQFALIKESDEATITYDEETRSINYMVSRK